MAIKRPGRAAAAAPRGAKGQAAPAGAAPRACRYWLMKSEPDVFSFADLEAAPRRTTFWEGVRNYQARNFMRDDMRVGDLVLYYHSNATPSGVAGVAEVAQAASPDPSQFDPASDYHDAGADPDAPRWLGVHLRALAPLRALVAIADLKANPALGAMAVVQRGQRLSVQPVSAEEFAEVLRMGGLEMSDLRIRQ